MVSGTPIARHTFAEAACANHMRAHKPRLFLPARPSHQGPTGNRDPSALRRSDSDTPEDVCSFLPNLPNLVLPCAVM